MFLLEQRSTCTRTHRNYSLPQQCPGVSSTGLCKDRQAADLKRLKFHGKDFDKLCSDIYLSQLQNFIQIPEGINQKRIYLTDYLISLQLLSSSLDWYTVAREFWEPFWLLAEHEAIKNKFSLIYILKGKVVTYRKNAQWAGFHQLQKDKCNDHSLCFQHVLPQLGESWNLALVCRSQINK